MKNPFVLWAIIIVLVIYGIYHYNTQHGDHVITEPVIVTTRTQKATVPVRTVTPIYVTKEELQAFKERLEKKKCNCSTQRPVKVKTVRQTLPPGAY